MTRAGKAVEESIVERSRWLIRLRWIAIAGVITTAASAVLVFKIPLPVIPLFCVVAILIVYNLIFAFLIARLKAGFANLQISLDLASLTALIHFSGGIENPFLFYFIFHMIIASILLSRRVAFLQATFVAVLFLAIVTLEYTHTLRHYCLTGFTTGDQNGNLLHIGGVSFVFVSTLYIAVYMATSITKRLRERETSLAEANKLLNEKDRIKSEYVLRVTHDIKEHLSAIQSCVETVTVGIAGTLNENQTSLLRRAQQRTVKLMAFVKALVEITRIKLAREIEFNYFSIRTTVENAVNFVDTKARNKGIIMSSNIAPTVDLINGAQIYIEETIANLLANAVKYTPAGGHVGIDVEDEGATVLIKIRDTGIGIPKDEIGKLFDEFYRATNARLTEKSGTGLGLAIAKQVVARHGGKIWVESEEGRGSVFSMILPKAGA